MIINSNILTRYLDNQLSEDEVRMVETALESSAELRTELELLRYIHTCSSDITEIQPSQIDQNWNEFINRVQEPPVKPVKKFNWFKYAAVAAILIFSGLFFYQSHFSGSVEHIAKTNQLFVLPDGSELLMSAGSTIGYNEKTFTSKRSVQMKGDILFRVKSNRKNPFFLLTSNSSIEVLGTKFRVFANTENTTVIINNAGNNNII